MPILCNTVESWRFNLYLEFIITQMFSFILCKLRAHETLTWKLKTGHLLYKHGDAIKQFRFIQITNTVVIDSVNADLLLNNWTPSTYNYMIKDEPETECYHLKELSK